MPLEDFGQEFCWPRDSTNAAAVGMWLNSGVPVLFFQQTHDGS